MSTLYTMFQRPKRASSISTMTWMYFIIVTIVFQRPKRASSISTKPSLEDFDKVQRFQRPKRASSISTTKEYGHHHPQLSCFNALNGLLLFLPGEELEWEFRRFIVSTP